MTSRRRAARARAALGPATLAVLAALLLAAPPRPAEAGTGATRVAVISFDPRSADPAVNRERLGERVREAYRRGARFVVAPELSVVPNADDDGGTAPHAEPIPGPTTEHFGRLAAELGIWIALSLAERIDEPTGYDAVASEGGHYLTTVLLNDRGRIADRYRKLMVRRSGPHPAVRGSFHDIVEAVDDGAGLRIGILAGDDLQVGVPRLAQRGAELLLVTAAWQADDPRPWRELASDLADRHGIDIAVADRPGPGPAAEAGAARSPTSRSGVFARDGTSTRPDAGGLLLRELSPRRRSWIRSALGMPPTVPLPTEEDAGPELAEVGRRLFFDPSLSSTGDVACATCHSPRRSFTNGLPKGVGVHGRQTQRNVPSLLNVAFRPVLRWDGYASTLENFTKYPLIGRNEMNSHDLAALVASVRETPAGRELRRVLGVERVELEHVERALATYQRTLISGNSPFDRFYYGGDESALDASARRGLELFQGRAGCSGCHRIGERYALFVDHSYHFLGVGYDEETGESPDIGLGTIATNRQAGFFLTPSLRNVAETAPYMHDGSLATLDEVIDFYVRGGIAAGDRQPDIEPIELSADERRDLIAFLRSLTGDHRYDDGGRRLDDDASSADGPPPAN